MDKLLIKRGSKRALEQLDPLQVGELFLAKDEERLYVGGTRGNIPIPTQKDLDEKATKAELQQVSLAYKESYDTLDDLKNAYPNGDVYNHVVLADGMIYTYAKGQWVSTGVEANGAIEFMKAYEDLKVLEIGGRNLLKDTSDEWTILQLGDSQYYFQQGTDTRLEIGVTYTFSILVEKVSDDDVPIRVNIGTGPKGDFQRDKVSEPVEFGKRFTRTFTITENDIANGYEYFAWRLRNDRQITTIRFKEVKLEKGNKATDWTPAPEDIDAHPFVVELAESVFRSKQNEERIRNLENAITALGGNS